MKTEIFRCNQTIDLEECINMQKKPENIEAVATYQSGRTERVVGRLKTDGSAYKTFSEKVEALKAFPTVVDVKVRTF